MRKLVYITVASFLIACGGNTEEKKTGPSLKKKTETKKTIVKKTGEDGIVDLSNKGIGPIKSISFGKINDDLASKGATYFKQKCTACHKTDKKLIGPAMTGIYERRSPEWVMNMMLNPTQMLKEDPIAKEQLKAYNGVLMIDQNLSEDEARAIAEYLRTI